VSPRIRFIRGFAEIKNKFNFSVVVVIVVVIVVAVVVEADYENDYDNDNEKQSKQFPLFHCRFTAKMNYQAMGSLRT